MGVVIHSTWLTEDLKEVIMKFLVVLVAVLGCGAGSTDVNVQAHDPQTGLPYSYSIITLDTPAQLPLSERPTGYGYNRLGGSYPYNYHPYSMPYYPSYPSLPYGNFYPNPYFHPYGFNGAAASVPRPTKEA